jgi:hypothetical protein
MFASPRISMTIPTAMVWPFCRRTNRPSARESLYRSRHRGLLDVTSTSARVLPGIHLATATRPHISSRYTIADRRDVPSATSSTGRPYSHLGLSCLTSPDFFNTATRREMFAGVSKL